MLGEFVQYIGCRSNGIGAEEQLQASLFSCGDETVSSCFVPRDIHVSAGNGSLTFNLICMGYGSMGVVSVVISCMDDLDICPGNFGLFGEFLADEIFGYFQIAVEQPAYQAYCKHIAAFQHGLVVHSGVGKAVFHHLRDGGGDDILLNTHFLYRIIGLESGLFQV